MAAVAFLEVTGSASAGGKASESQHRQPSGSSWSGVSVLVGRRHLISPTGWEFQGLQNSSKNMVQNISYSSQGRTKDP